MIKKLSGVLGALAMVATVCSGAATRADAQAYPTKPIRLVLPFGPGGAADVTARLLGQKMGASLGQQVFIDNKPSAGGIIASQVVLSQPPDGYDLFFLTSGQAISVSLFKKLPFDTAKDFEPVSLVGSFPILILVDKSSPMKTLKDMMDAMKAKPGQINVGAVNIGSTQDLTAELFKSLSGLNFQIIPFKTTPALVTALTAGEIQVGFEIVAPVIGQIHAGALRPLAVSAPERFSELPNVPTVKESGIPDFDVVAWNSIAVRTGTPQPVIDKLHQAIQAALAQPDLRQKFTQLGIEPKGSTPEEAKALLVKEIAKWGKVIKDAKIPLK
jgi:tripartite-type tricarboxylate transporter receptor subunit TctC